jgi:3D (Asp-Asp-Asp) domain-containing protein
MTVVATAYALQGTTAVGIQTQPGIVAVDPTVIPLGAKMSIPGYGDGVAADTGSAVKGAIIDVWFPTIEEARAWGRRTVTITFR